MRTSRPSRFAVLDCENGEKWAGHERYWIDGLRRDGDEWRSYRVWAGELPDDSSSLAGAVITGSHDSATDDSLPWLDPLLGFLRAAAAEEAGPRLVGACFGCHALARALGGRVGGNPHGRFVFGAERIALRPALLAAAWFAGDEGRGGEAGPRDSVSLLQSHGDSVVELPPGAQLFGSSSSAAHEMFGVGERVLAVQGHPELPRQALVDTILPALREKQRIDAEEERAALRSMEGEVDGPFMMCVIRRFLDGPR